MIYRNQSVFFVLSENCHRRKNGTINQRCVVVIRRTCIVFETLTAETRIAADVVSARSTSDLIWVNNTCLHRSWKGLPSVGPIRPGRNHFSDYRLAFVPARLRGLICTDQRFIAIENPKIELVRAVWYNFCVRIFELYIYDRWTPRDTSRSLYIDFSCRWVQD